MEPTLTPDSSGGNGRARLSFIDLANLFGSRRPAAVMQRDIGDKVPLALPLCQCID